METSLHVYKRQKCPNETFYFIINFCSELSKWADPNTGNLLQTRVHHWMEGIVIKFADKYNREHPYQEVRKHFFDKDFFADKRYYCRKSKWSNQVQP